MKASYRKEEPFKNAIVHDETEVTRQDGHLALEAGDLCSDTDVQDSRAETQANHRLYSRRSWGSLVLWVVLVIVAVLILATVLSLKGRDSYDYDDWPPPATVDYSSGVSLVTYYGIEASVRSRLAQTKITMEVANALDCPSIHGMTLQLPFSTRVVSLQIRADDTCTAGGVIEKLTDARESFLGAASEGLPEAYIEEQDTSTYSLQVAISPLGFTTVELVLEDLLQQRLGEVNFEIPFTPNEAVDTIVLDLPVEEVGYIPTSFHLENLDETSLNETANQTTQFQLKLQDAREYSLPTVVRGSYNPTAIPDSGDLTLDGACFEHYFHPTSVAPMSRTIIFVLDTSFSMVHYGKLDAAKTALKNFIAALTTQDRFAIQTFHEEGSVSLWGYGAGSVVEKLDAMNFIDSLDRAWGSANLREAFLAGLLRAREDQTEEKVAILVMISSGWPSAGETNRTKIAEDVFKLNQDGKVKIFSLGFKDSADMELLDAIATMNGGVSTPLFQGRLPYVSQIESFFEGEFGSVLLSDVRVDFDGSAALSSQVAHIVPLLADGYEIVTRGLLEEQGDPITSLRAVTTASTSDGITQWTTEGVVRDTSTVSHAQNSLCYQSYAHDRITQLLRFRSAAKFVSRDILETLVTLSQGCHEDTNFRDCITAEVELLALKANIVVKGITTMTTIDDKNCFDFELEKSEICRDGTTADELVPDQDYPSAARARCLQNIIVAALCILHALKVTS